MMTTNWITEADYASQMRDIAVPYINARRSEGNFPGHDAKPLHETHFRADAPRGAVVILHGFTESCQKYDEMVCYFLRNGYHVFLPEHRGHGLSYRQVPDKTITHIDRFGEYVDDLETYIDTVVRKEWQGPLYIYAHSMGGAIAALYMERHPEAIEKAVLSAPMIAPATGGVPAWVARTLAGIFCLLGKGTERSFTSRPYGGKEKFEHSCSTSAARFDYYAEKKFRTDYLQNSSPSYSWIYQSIGVTRRILRRGGPESIRTKILLFSSPNDTLVLPEPQKAFVRRLPRAEFVSVEGTKHETFSSPDQILYPYVEKIMNFLSEA